MGPNLTTQMTALEINGVAVDDTFAEAFPAMATRVVITAVSAHWAGIAAAEFCGYATSVIACNAEAAIEKSLAATDTPDGRPGVSVLVFAFGRAALEEAVSDRVGQCVLTCPTTACYSGLEAATTEKHISVGGRLRYFGDTFQFSKKLDGKRYWRIPVMDGEFVCEDRFGALKGVAGGNLIVAGVSQSKALSAVEAAVAAIREVGDIILPFPGGVVRSGSKVGSRYKKLKASTNDAYCPTLQPLVDSDVGSNVACVYEIVIDGLTLEKVTAAMRSGLHAVCACDGVVRVTAGNYGGKLGPHHIKLCDLVDTASGGE